MEKKKYNVKERKEKMVDFRISKEDHEKLLKKAQEENKSISKLLRELIQSYIA